MLDHVARDADELIGDPAAAALIMDGVLLPVIQSKSRCRGTPIPRASSDCPPYSSPAKLSGSRKNIYAISEVVPDTDERNLQQFIRREEESHNENNEPSMSLLHIDNDGPLIVVSNYWESEPAQAGYLYLSVNAGGISVAYPAEPARIYF